MKLLLNKQNLQILSLLPILTGIGILIYLLVRPGYQIITNFNSINEIVASLCNDQDQITLELPQVSNQPARAIGTLTKQSGGTKPHLILMSVLDADYKVIAQAEHSSTQLRSPDIDVFTLNNSINLADTLYLRLQTKGIEVGSDCLYIYGSRQNDLTTTFLQYGTIVGWEDPRQMLEINTGRIIEILSVYIVQVSFAFGITILLILRVFAGKLWRARIARSLLFLLLAGIILRIIRSMILPDVITLSSYNIMEHYFLITYLFGFVLFTDWRIWSTKNIRIGINYYLAIAFTLIAVTLATRTIGIGNTQPFRDEIPYLMTNRINIETPGTVIMVNQQPVSNYERSEFIYLPSRLSMELFGNSPGAARLPGALLGVAVGALLIFWIGRFNRMASLVIGGLWAISPWAIEIAQYLREYTYYQIWYIITGIALYWISQQIISALKQKQVPTFNRNFTVKLLLVTTLLIGNILYWRLFDNLSTFRNIILLYIGTAAYLFIRINLEFELLRKYRWRYLITLVIMSILAMALVIGLDRFGVLEVSGFRVIPKLETEWLNELWLQPSIHATVISFILVLLGLALSWHNRHVNTWWLFSACMFVVILYFYLFHFDRYYALRYINIIHPWWLMLEALAIVSVIPIFTKRLHSFQQKAYIAGILLLLIINIPFIIRSSLQILNSDNKTFARSDHMFDAASLVATYGDEIKDPGNILITAHPQEILWALPDQYLGMDNIYSYSVYSPDKFAQLADLVSQNSSGLIALSRDRNLWSEPLPFANFVTGDKVVCYLGVTGKDVLVYRWGNKCDLPKANLVVVK